MPIDGGTSVAQEILKTEHSFTFINMKYDESTQATEMNLTVESTLVHSLETRSYPGAGVSGIPSTGTLVWGYLLRKE